MTLKPAKGYRSPTAVDIADCYKLDFYSSAIIGPGAQGAVKLFTSPLGQEIPRIGTVPADLFSSHIPITTNVLRPAHLGDSYGDMVIRQIRADFIGGDLPSIQEILKSATYTLRVSNKIEAEGGLRDLPKTGLTVPVGRFDSLVAEIEFKEKIRMIDPILLRVVLSGDATRDVR